MTRWLGAALLVVAVGGLISPAATQCPPFTVPVTFTYLPLPHQQVTSVSLRGSFNNWGEWPMEEQPDGSWTITVCLEPGTHQYKYFINGQWPRDMATDRDGGPLDPQADGYVDDGFGGQNAIRIVRLPIGDFYLRHRPDDPAYRCVADGRLVIRAQVPPETVQELWLVTQTGKFPMERQLSWPDGEMWRAALPLAPASYRFQGTRTDGQSFSLPEESAPDFQFSGQDPFPQLDWLAGGVGYQIFPDRFYNGDPANDALALETDAHNFNLFSPQPILSAWGDPITELHCCHQYFGGDLAGIIEKLDYLRSLGVTLLYLNPIFTSGSAHGYDTHDYLEVAPRLGTEAELRELLEEAHARGMRVIFDFVPNHTGVGFWTFQDVVERGPESPYWDWYFIRRWPFTPGDAAAYQGWWGLGSLPKLNTGNPQVREYLYRVALHWLDFGFDGLRVDVPNELVDAHSFFAELRARVRERHPQAYLVGEIWQLSPQWVQGDQFDSLMNYALGRDILLRYARGELSGEEALGELARYHAAYGENVVGMGFNVVSTHDTSRVLTDLGGGDLGDTPSEEALARLRLLSTLLYTLPGVPVVFQGEERGELGAKENHDAQRYPIQWERVNQEVLEHFRQLAELRQELPALATSRIHTYAAKDGVLSFFRGHEREVLVVANNSPELVVFTLPPGSWRVVESGAVLSGSTVIPPLYAWVLVQERE
ncbi:pullulanase [Candidatus Bipolaricaulota bacterium]|nr:pullulanase [Candidatus Bipolaricaulota bacterium]